MWLPPFVATNSLILLLLSGSPLVVVAVDAGSAVAVSAARQPDEQQQQQQQQQQHSGNNGNNDTTVCSDDSVKHQFNPFLHKRVYTIGVHAIRGLEQALKETNHTFASYLTATAGRKFHPTPIEFQVQPLYFDGIFNAIDNEQLDFLYSNPGVYSCVGTEIGATALTTAIKRLTVRDKTFDLDVYGGVIAVRADNKDINSITDLKDKIIGAGAIIDLMGGQMQIYEMFRAGMSYVNDPRQFVFTKDQIDVVQGVLDKTFDAGFIRTDQIELTKDKDGNLLDPDLFKIIEPKIFVMDNGDLFPFLHSTNIFPEWPLASLPNVPADVALEVQEALLSLSKYAKVGDELNKCIERFDKEQCEAIEPKEYYRDAPCDTTWEIARLASEGSNKGHFAGFRTSRSYFELRTMQQEAGFMLQDDEGNWYCTRPSNLHEGITCPEGYFKRSEDEFLNGCGQVGLTCDKEGYDCFCKPCVRAFDVDVYQYREGDEDLHLVEYYGESLPGCEKMSICGTVEQGDSLTLRIFDNEMRDDADVRVESHAGDDNHKLEVTRVEGTHAYEITVSDETVRTQVIDVFVNGKPISQSPLRVMVVPKNCEAIYGEGSKRSANDRGSCVCDDNTYELGNTCVESHFFFIMIFSMAFVVVGAILAVFLQYKKQQSDLLWHVNVEELHLNEPPEVIGIGAFGVVILGQYRGTKVAVKRVLPPQGMAGLTRGSVSSSGSLGAKGSGTLRTAHKSTRGDSKDSLAKAVKFSGDPEGDIEAPPEKKPGSLTMSNNKAWEELMLDDHKYNSALKILESATLSNHGSTDADGFNLSASRSSKLIDLVPFCLRFDRHSRLRREFMIEMRLLSRLRHPCITTVMGAVVAPRVDPMLVMEYMEYGSLYDLLRNETMYAGGEIILQIIKDITQGINFLHSSKPEILHGDLKAKNILVDSRFRAKVADFGFSHVKNGKSKNVLQGTPFFMAPEYLRRKTEYTTQCDMYSYGMILYEIYARQDPFDGEDPRNVLPKICHPRINRRPKMPEACPPKMSDVIKKCWSANPFFRPTAKDVDYILVEMRPSEAEPLVQEQQTLRERNKPTSLYDVFPKHIADALNAGKRVEPESHEMVTVVFSDIVGFTTISQTFEPLQVSKMLDRLYQSFDAIARKHNIFKVETIGDAYMGVTNLSGDEFETHVKQVAEYAIDIVAASNKILIDNDHPERGTVKIRVGFHSGPVVSNVIGSLNPRYGLFGDTVNTASRMESNSVVGRIHCTHASAQLLMHQAPDLPVTLRGRINVKGKGKMMTYWVANDEMISHPLLDASEGLSESNPNHLADTGTLEDTYIGDIQDIVDDKEPEEVNSALGCTPKTDQESLVSDGTPKTDISDSFASSFCDDPDNKINGVSDILLDLAKKIVATRVSTSTRSPVQDEMIRAMEKYIGKDKTLLEEANESIDMPQSNKNAQQCDPKKIILDSKVQEQLYHFVEEIATLHKPNPFHNFDHAVHVVEMIHRFLVNSERELLQENGFGGGGLLMDKVSQFAIVVAALIHDVDHRGMPNFCLEKADPKLHEKYQGRACQEQNSLETGWEVWLRPEFAELRACVYQSGEEFIRFRKVLVRQFIATDIFDPDLTKRRQKQWHDAFVAGADKSQQPTDVETNDHASSIKETAVMELLITASDIGHTMQSWNKYVKWNAMLFEEMRRAHKLGLIDKDPSLQWYDGELQFFDKYVVPLANRIKECGVLGSAAGEEYLKKAERNRMRFEESGKELVNGWLAMHGPTQPPHANPVQAVADDDGDAAPGSTSGTRPFKAVLTRSDSAAAA